MCCQIKPESDFCGCCIRAALRMPGELARGAEALLAPFPACHCCQRAASGACCSTCIVASAEPSTGLPESIATRAARLAMQSQRALGGEARSLSLDLALPEGDFAQSHSPLWSCRYVDQRCAAGGPEPTVAEAFFNSAAVAACGAAAAALLRLYLNT